jgi:hypothetical protein
MWLYDKNTKIYKTNTPDPRIKVEVGDSKDLSNLQPRIKLLVWDNECNLSIGLPINSSFIERVEETDGILTVEAPSKDISAKFYPKLTSFENPEGAFEFEIILHKKPNTNIIPLTMNIPKGLIFYYQPPLTKSEIADGMNRPPHVVGSYAVYHSNKGNIHRGSDGEKYKTGKAFHIYRPHIIDAEGNETWGDLSIDVENQIMTITIPQQWLNTAKYPVGVDPTFGYTTAGGSYYGLTNNIRGSAFTAPDNGIAKSITRYGRGTSAGSNQEYALYSETGDFGDDAFIRKTGEGYYLGTNNWDTLNLTSDATITKDSDYWLLVNAGNTSRLYYDSTTAQSVSLAQTYGTWPSTLSGSSSNTSIIFSIYCTYEEAADVINLSGKSTTQTRSASSITLKEPLNLEGYSVTQNQASLEFTTYNQYLDLRSESNFVNNERYYYRIRRIDNDVAGDWSNIENVLYQIEEIPIELDGKSTTETRSITTIDTKIRLTGKSSTDTISNTSIDSKIKLSGKSTSDSISDTILDTSIRITTLKSTTESRLDVVIDTKILPTINSQTITKSLLNLNTPSSISIRSPTDSQTLIDLDTSISLEIVSTTATRSYLLNIEVEPIITVVTRAVTNIGTTSARLHGTITFRGGGE